MGSALQTLHNSSGFVEYPHPLPYGLSFKSTLDEATRIFGDSALNHPSGEGRMYIWYNFHGNTVGLCLLPDNQGVSFMALSKAAKQPPVPFDWD